MSFISYLVEQERLHDWVAEAYPSRDATIEQDTSIDIVAHETAIARGVFKSLSDVIDFLEHFLQSSQRLRSRISRYVACGEQSPTVECAPQNAGVDFKSTNFVELHKRATWLSSSYYWQRSQAQARRYLMICACPTGSRKIDPSWHMQRPDNG